MAKGFAEGYGTHYECPATYHIAYVVDTEEE